MEFLKIKQLCHEPKFLGKEITPFESIQLQRVPLIIHIPGQKGKTISTVSGQIDVRPTLLHLLGIENDDYIEFGKDHFSEEKFRIHRFSR